MRRALLILAAALGLALGAPGLAERAAAAAGSDLQSLSAAASLVGASSSEIGGLLSQGSPSPALVHDAGDRLAAAGVALKQVLAGYRSAKPYGSQQEAALIGRTLEQLLEARAGFGTLVGARAKPSTAAAKDKVADQVLAGLRNDIGLAVDEHLGVTGLTEALSAGGLRGARSAITSQLRTALRGEVERQIKRLTGLGLALGVPVKEQLAIAAEQALVRLLAKIAAKSTPAGILVELIGSKVIHFVGDAIRKAFRGSGKLDSRTAKTLKGFDNRLADLAAAVSSGDARRVRRVIGQAERALGATGFLKDDLKRKRRVDLLDAIAAKESELRAAVEAAKEQFVIDSPLGAIDFAKAIDLVDKVIKEVNALNRSSCPIRPARGGGECAVPSLAGQWLGQDGGRYTITQASGSSAISWTACDSNGGTLWTHTFTGKISGGYVVGTFVDGPPGTLRNTGTLVLAIQGTNGLSWVASATVDGKTHTSFPTLTRQWTRGSHAGCSGGGSSSFTITSVNLPPAVVANGSKANLYVYWQGNPAFPVTMVYAPDSCPIGLNCSTPTTTFTGPGNPFVFIDAVWCSGQFQSDIYFDYSVYLVDANGVKTQKANADFTCEPF